MKEKNQHTPTGTVELEKSTIYIVVKITEYLSNAVVSKTILKRSTGNVTAMSFDKGEELGEKTIAFDTFIQVIDGEAEVTIDKKTHLLILGDGIIIPAHTAHCYNAKKQFKIISTVIKSGYEE